MAQGNNSAIDELEKHIGYCFSDKMLLYTAITHSSYAKAETASKKDANVSDNERLEFLGDAVLELCVSELLFKSYHDLKEGSLTRMRAAMVCEEALYEAAKKIHLDEYILLSFGEQQSGGRKKPSLLSDAVEAIIGAVFLDGGISSAREFIKRFIDTKADMAVLGNKDSKTLLQEFVQERHLGVIEYNVICCTGPVHKPSFSVEVTLDGRVLGKGIGGSKQAAGKQAAGMALSLLTEQEKVEKRIQD